MKFEIREDVRAEVGHYLQAAGESQAVIQDARHHLAWFRLGRQACTQAERELVEVVYSADRVLRDRLSGTLESNQRKKAYVIEGAA